jgi:recombinational DNA repair ATPase RecF
MGKLISLAATLAVLAASTGQLPMIVLNVQLAQLYLIKDSQASKWPKAMTLPSR